MWNARVRERNEGCWSYRSERSEERERSGSGERSGEQFVVSSSLGLVFPFFSKFFLPPSPQSIVRHPCDFLLPPWS